MNETDPVEPEIDSKFNELQAQYPEVGLAVLLGFGEDPNLESLLDAPEGQDRYFAESERLMQLITTAPRTSINSSGLLGYHVSLSLVRLLPDNPDNLANHMRICSEIRSNVSWMVK